jgi:uncharacterized protein
VSLLDPQVDRVSQPWWDATRERRLVVQRCTTCGHHQHYPRPVCLACAGTELGFVDAAGTGRVHAFTVVHRAPTPEFEPPYVVALVRLDEGVTLLTNVIDCAPDDMRAEERVTVDWQPLHDGRHLPVFRPLRDTVPD